MSEVGLAATKATFERVLAAPTPADLWELGQLLLVGWGDESGRARAVIRTFHGCLRSLESKSRSRTASRWGAALGTGAVGSVSATEMLDRREGALHKLLQSGVPAMLEVGSALKSAEAWEVEADLVYDELAWFLFDELWDVSLAARAELAADDRRAQIAGLLDPLLDASVPEVDRAALVVDVFRSVLAARVLPLLGPAGAEAPAEG